MTSVFVLQHLHNLPSGEEDVKMIGVYSTQANAEAAVERLSKQPGFRDAPQIVDDDEGFYIDRYEINIDNWSEGYVTMVGDCEMTRNEDT